MLVLQTLCQSMLDLKSAYVAALDSLEVSRMECSVDSHDVVVAARTKRVLWSCLLVRMPSCCGR